MFNHRANTITTQEHNVETPKMEKNHDRLSKPTNIELLLCEIFYNT